MPRPTLRLAPVTIATFRSKRGAIQAFFVLMLWLLGNDLRKNANGKSRISDHFEFVGQPADVRGSTRIAVPISDGCSRQ